MKICIYHEHHPAELQYGGELSTLHWAQQAIIEGHDVEWITSDGKRYVGAEYKSTRSHYLEEIRDADLYLLGTFHSYPDELLQQLKDKKYAAVHHHSMPQSDHYLTQGHELSIFLAPDHSEHLPNVTAKKEMVTTCYIEPNNFYNMGLERKKECVYVGTIAGSKIGTSMFRHMQDHPKGTYNFYGDHRDPNTVNALKLMQNVTVNPEVPYDAVNEVLNQYAVFYWHLDRYGCYGRTIIEAALAGCRIEVNEENFGIFKYDWDLSDRDSIVNKLESDLHSFWDTVINMLDLE